VGISQPKDIRPRGDWVLQSVEAGRGWDRHLLGSLSAALDVRMASTSTSHCSAASFESIRQPSRRIVTSSSEGGREAHSLGQLAYCLHSTHRHGSSVGVFNEFPQTLYGPFVKRW